MDANQKPAFIERLTEIMLAYGKPLHDEAVLGAWWRQLEEFPLRVVALAFSAYREENDTYAPVPNSIYKRCLSMDGRPGAEEAWAIALHGTDEADTVVWTKEIAAAFEICRPVLETSGAISARKPFMEAYSRLVVEARAVRRPAEWIASKGWDPARQVEVIKAAAAAGRLPAPMVAALLPGSVADSEPTPEGRAQLAQIKAMLAAAEEEREARRLAEVERKRLEDEAQKARLQQQVNQRLRIVA